MIKLLPDIITKVGIYTKVKPYMEDWTYNRDMRIPFVFEEKNYDCTVLLEQNGLILYAGETKELPIKFLSPWLIKPRLKSGSLFKLWNGRNIGEGEVLRLILPAEQKGASVAIEILELVFKGRIIRSNTEKTNKSKVIFKTIVMLNEPTTYNGNTYEYLITQNQLEQTNDYEGRYSTSIVRISSEEANSNNIFEKNYFSGDYKFLRGNVIGSIYTIAKNSKQTGLSVEIEILQTELYGKIVKAGKDNTNRLRAVVKLDNRTSFKSADFKYLVTQDKQMEHWPESFDLHHFPSNIAILSQAEANSNKVLEMDYFDNKNKVLLGTIRLLA